MLHLTTPQVEKLTELVSQLGTKTFSITQNYAGHEESCDHIFIEWDTGSCRVDPDGNRFDNQTKEDPA